MTDKNNFAMPFIMTSEDFAAYTVQRLAEDEAIITPFNLIYLTAWLAHSIPPALLSLVFNRRPAKSSSSSKKDE